MCALRSLFWWLVRSWLFFFLLFLGGSIGKIDCAFVASELAFSFHFASACDVCCDLRRRRRKKFPRNRSIGTLRKTRKKLVLEKQKIS
jgi:hypothetical protein